MNCTNAKHVEELVEFINVETEEVKGNKLDISIVLYKILKYYVVVR